MQSGHLQHFGNRTGKTRFLLRNGGDTTDTHPYPDYKYEPYWRSGMKRAQHFLAALRLNPCPLCSVADSLPNRSSYPGLTVDVMTSASPLSLWSMYIDLVQLIWWILQKCPNDKCPLATRDQLRHSIVLICLTLHSHHHFDRLL